MRAHRANNSAAFETALRIVGAAALVVLQCGSAAASQAPGNCDPIITDDSRLSDVLKLCGAILAILAGLAGLYFGEGAVDKKTRIPRAGGVLIILVLCLGTFLSYVLDRQKANADASDQRHMTACLRDLQSRTITLNNQLATTSKDLGEKTAAAIRGIKSVGVALDTSTGSLLRRTAKVQSRVEAGVDLQHEQLVESAALSRSQLRGLYPLEPFGITYAVEVPMDQRLIAPYTKRLEKAIGEMQDSNNPALGHRTIADVERDLRAGGAIWNISNLEPIYQPGFVQSDGAAKSLLLSDYTLFEFAEPQGAGTIAFASVPRDDETRYVTLPHSGHITQDVFIEADFQRRVFTKGVKATNLLRVGSDRIAKGALDLAGTRMTWKMIDDYYRLSDPKWRARSRVVGVSFNFPWTYGGGYNARSVTIEKGVMSIAVTAKALGLDSVTPYGFERVTAKEAPHANHRVVSKAAKPATSGR